MKNTPTPAQVQAAREGDEKALAAIITYFMPTLTYQAHRATRPGLDFDDAVQEGIIGLFRAIKTYRCGQDASFTTYANVCLRNSIASAQKAAGRRKHAPLNYSVPIPENQSIPGPEETAIASEQVALALRMVHDRLSPLEIRVLGCYLEGLSYNQIAKRLGKTPKSVENALARARRKLQQPLQPV